MPWTDFGTVSVNPAWFMSCWWFLGPEAWRAAHLNRCALFFVPGLTALMHMPDWMHVMCLGMAQTIVGCSLFEMAWEGTFGFMDIGDSKVRLKPGTPQLWEPSLGTGLQDVKALWQ